jgi:arylsulfatase A-like enzyme
MMTRRELLTTTAAAAGTAMGQGQKRPNILFLMPDQQRYHAMGCAGDPDVKTPHIDKLAAQGLMLRNTIANTPVCCPARANLLTGQYAHRNGMVANDLRLREGGVSWAREFGAAGYRTGFVGKWHLDGGPRMPGFVPPGERRHGFEYWAANQCSHQHFDNTYFRDTPEVKRLGKFESEGWADRGVEFLEATQKDNRPFFLTIQWGPPHDPYKAPENYRRMYDAAKLEMRPNWRQAPKAPGREEIAHYYGMVTSLDDQVGRLMAKLEALGLAENTVVLYSSDHGDMLGSHGQRLKRKPWEESIRVPGIIRWPGWIKAGTSSDAIFTHVDFAPTLLGLAGLKAHPKMQGSNLADVMTGRSAKSPDAAYLAIHGSYQGDDTPGAWRGIRTRTHVYAKFQDKPWMLHDIEKDPFEMRNLVDERSAAPLMREMENRLAAKMKETGDAWSNDWTGLAEDAGRLYRHRTFYTVGEYQEWAKANPEAAAVK